MGKKAVWKRAIRQGVQIGAGKLKGTEGWRKLRVRRRREGGRNVVLQTHGEEITM